jgi:hypothetical protein
MAGSGRLTRFLLVGCNVGYAFVNFIHVQDLLVFAKAKLGVKWSVRPFPAVIMADAHAHAPPTIQEHVLQRENPADELCELPVGLFSPFFLKHKKTNKNTKNLQTKQQIEVKKHSLRNSRTRALWTSARRGSPRSFTRQALTRGFLSRSPPRRI